MVWYRRANRAVKNCQPQIFSGCCSSSLISCLLHQMGLHTPLSSVAPPLGLLATDFACIPLSFFRSALPYLQSILYTKSGGFHTSISCWRGRISLNYFCHSGIQSLALYYTAAVWLVTYGYDLDTHLLPKFLSLCTRTTFVVSSLFHSWSFRRLLARVILEQYYRYLLSYLQCVKFNSLNFEFLFAVGSHLYSIVGVFFATLPLSFYLHA